ncbi:hypothetical protein [Leptothoe kymatousa]|uniref:Uncharacterized protein n=1 Tax=Leptothoe kymatousa TAU-MAC 1615 TaxID=2364775 RepID=A0ABS5Y542_9CYAN|nr:hypothetical protein [Leptothoe kymatousa]MBT9312613.1 hypothetical protein [Leptothoe kymatousa TAU-MAC 1615]
MKSSSMAKINIAHETSSAAAAEKHAQKLRRNGETVTLICRETFPIADAMFPFLAHLSATADYTLILLPPSSTSSSSVWISKELHLQHSLGNFTNIYPAFSNHTDVPRWWATEDSTVRILS